MGMDSYEKLRLEYRDPKTLKPNERNWRKHPEQQKKLLDAMIKEVGYAGALLWNSQTQKLIDGHARRDLAIANKEKLVPVLVGSWTEAEEKKILATLDPIAAMAKQADELYRELLEGMETESEDLKEWCDGMLEGLREPEPGKDAEPQIDRAQALNEIWKVKAGDLWLIGEHRLLCGDSTKAEDVARLMGGEEVGMVVADPPYGISIVVVNVSVGGGEAYDIPFGGKKKGNVGRGSAHMRKTGKSYLEEWNQKKRGTVGAPKPFGSKKKRGSDGAANIIDVGKYAPIIGDDTTDTAIRASSLFLQLYPRAKQFWFGGNHYANALPQSSCWVVWDKETTGNFSDCELAWSNQDKAARLFRHRWNGMLRDSERERRFHPSQKPAALASWIYETFGKENDIVVDPFAGAGWTLVAAQNTKRTARLIEMSEDYCAVILQRMKDAFAIEGVRIEG
jgi:hypothetical protein